MKVVIREKSFLELMSLGFDTIRLGMEIYEEGNLGTAFLFSNDSKKDREYLSEFCQQNNIKFRVD